LCRRRILCIFEHLCSSPPRIESCEFPCIPRLDPYRQKEALPDTIERLCL